MEPYLDRNKDETGLHIDADVALWLDYRSTHQLPPLLVVQGLNFVIVDNQLMNEFLNFKQKEVQLGFSFLKCNHLLKMWLSQTKAAVPVSKYDNEYVYLNCTQIDDLCQWVMEMRDNVAKNGEAELLKLIEKRFLETHCQNRNEQRKTEVIVIHGNFVNCIHILHNINYLQMRSLLKDGKLLSEPTSDAIASEDDLVSLMVSFS